VRTTTPTKSTATTRLGVVVSAMGIVFGDIATSPLYTLQECLSGPHGVAPHAANVLGCISLVVWSLLIVVTLKYVGVLMQADNRGEGGILALLALVPRGLRERAPGVLGTTTVLVLIGASLLFGDGIITPAISVLSAVEGLRIAAPGLEAVRANNRSHPCRALQHPEPRQRRAGALFRSGDGHLARNRLRAGRGSHRAAA
jgi:KUP system potassium uptake protein